MKTRPLLAAMTLVLLLTSCNQSTASTTLTEITSPNVTAPEPPLRLSEPVDTVVADLKDYIPDRMREAEIPGLAIALIRDGEVVWTEGFGVANTNTGEPITSETVFEVASNSKVVAAYTALRLVEQGKLSLDEPLTASLSKPWLPPSEYGDKITLRHLASHSSGLTDNLLPVDKTIAFAPGSEFFYSGVGFLYAQEAVEQVTGTSLEDAAQETVFEPLSMSSSSFVNKADILPRMANGHMAYSFPLLAFVVPFVVIFIGISLVGVLILRIRTGKWRPTWQMVVGAGVVAAILTLLIIILLLGKALPNMALLITLCAAAFAVAFTVTVFIGRQIIVRLLPTRQKINLQRAFNIIWIGLSIVVLLWLAGLVTVQVPKGPSPHPSAVGSLRTSAPDLATFLIELAEPQHLSKDMAIEIRTPQVPIDDDFSWGLGIGIQHSKQGDALWQNGQTFGFRSVMVIYPEHGIGAVVLTNSDQGLPVAYDVAQRALGGKAYWIFF